MSFQPPWRRPRHTLPWLALAVGLIGVAYTLRPPRHTDPAVFWVLAGLGALALLIALWPFGSGIPGRARSPDHRTQRHLVAVECIRLSEALTQFIEARLAAKPRGIFVSADRGRRWREELRSAYRDHYLTWGLKTFDAAARLDGVAATSRSVVEDPSPEQLITLPDLFRDAARSLELAA